MQIAVLGPLEVDVDGSPVVITGGRLRRLLTRLAVDAGRVVSSGELVDAVWLRDQPGDVANGLQSLVSRLRRSLRQPHSVTQVASGYRLDLPPDHVDLVRFTTAASAAQRLLAADDPAAAYDAGEAALALWRGEPLTDADEADYALPVVARLEQQRLGVLADRADAQIRLGRAASTAAELEGLVAAHPLRERFVGLLMRALAQDGRSAAALSAYDRLRKRLADELGTDPSPTLQEIHLGMLRGTAVEVHATPPRATTNLRTSLTSFIGREDDLTRVMEVLATGRLATIVGPGGAGKTRLAMEVGQRWRDRVVDGAWLVELASVTDPANIAPAMLSSLGIRDKVLDRTAADRTARDAQARLLDNLADADCLLLVDNCEHLIDGVAALVDIVLATCPGVRVLATSREPLGLPGEGLCALAPLGLPPEDATPAQALDYPAVQLLAERARSANAGFRVDETTVADVVRIARRLDGLPLALELAAARLRVLPVAELADRLSDRFRLLTGGNRTALPRHQTLRAVVEWSWDLLTKDERLLAERLAVFPAGATAESAAAICADERLDLLDIPDLLIALVDKSLLQVADRVDTAGTRYRMLETIREYGVERLAERGEIDSVRRAHATYFLDLVERIDPILRTRDQLPAMALLKAEQDNVVSATRYLGDAGDVDAALRMAVGASWFWNITGANEQWAVMLDYVVAVTEGHDDHPLRPYVEALRLLASVTSGQYEASGREAGEGPWESLSAMLRPVLDRMETVPTPQYEGLTVFRPMLAMLAGDEERAERLSQATMLGDSPWNRGAVLNLRAALAENSGDVDAMRPTLAEAYDIFEELGERWGLSSVLNNRGMVRMLDGDLHGAVADYERARVYIAEIGSAEDDLLVELRLSDLQLRLGSVEGARAHLAAARRSTSARGFLLDRTLFLDAAEVGLLIYERRIDEASGQLARLRAGLAPRSSANPLGSHLRAMVLSTSANAGLIVGTYEAALADLREAYAAAVETEDQPIVATTGLVAALTAEAAGELTTSARLLGAAARIRGAVDPTDVRISEVTARLRQALGDRFDPAYADGWRLPKADAVAAIDPALLPEHADGAGRLEGPGQPAP